MDTGQHFSVTKEVVRLTEWLDEGDHLPALQAFNWFPDYLSIIDLFKKPLYLLGWVDYLPLYLPIWGWTERRIFSDVRGIKQLSEGTPAFVSRPPFENKVWHQFHFDNLFSFQAIRQHWGWLWDQTVYSLQECDLRLLLASLGNSLHAVQDFYSHSSWVEFFANQGFTRPEDFPTYADLFPIPQEGWEEAVETLLANQTTPLGTVYTGYYPPAKNSPLGARYHDDRRKKPGLQKDQAARPFFDVVYHLAVRHSRQWLSQLQESHKEAFSLLGGSLDTVTLEKILDYRSRAKVLSQKTRHWDRLGPLTDVRVEVEKAKLRGDKLFCDLQVQSSDPDPNLRWAHVTVVLNEGTQIVGEWRVKANRGGHVRVRQKVPLNNRSAKLGLEVRYGLLREQVSLS